MIVKSMRLQNKHINFKINVCRRKGIQVGIQGKKEVSFLAFTKELVHEII